MRLDPEGKLSRPQVDVRTASSTHGFAAWTSLLAGVSLCGCAAVVARPTSPPAEERYLIVDCLLPSRLVPLPGLGGAIPLPRSPAKTTAESCLEQGGEYKVIDRAWSLKVWSPKANVGDAQAQYYVGTIYETGAGSAPDLPLAAQWYRRAAEQGHRPAAARLARLYELGTGVPRDWAEALKWYLVAEAVEDRGQVVERTRGVQRKLERREEELRREIEERERGPSPGATGDTVRLAAVLGRPPRGQDVVQLTDLGTPLYAPSDAFGGSASANAVEGSDDSGGHHHWIMTAERSLAEVEKELAAVKAEKEALQRRLDEVGPDPGLPPRSRGRDVTRADLGKYYAVIIGNRDYIEWDPLKTTINDATAIKQILEKKYGFEKPVELVANGDFDGMLKAIERYREKIKNDVAKGISVSFLLFYGGHGNHRPITGYWIPVDGPREFSYKWIQDKEIAAQLDVMQARQILVIADSCYGNTMARGDLTEDDSPLDVQTIAKQQPRMILSAGGDHPVYEDAEADHSVFTRELIGVLEAHHGVLTGQQLFNAVAPRVRRAAENLRLTQNPVYEVINLAGHTSGDFILMAD